MSIIYNFFLALKYRTATLRQLHLNKRSAFKVNCPTKTIFKQTLIYYTTWTSVFQILYFEA